MAEPTQDLEPIVTAQETNTAAAITLPPKAFHPPVTGQGKTYDLAHLNPFFIEVPSLLVKDKAALKVFIRFSNHCFTDKYNEGTHPSGFPVMHDHNGRARSFCFERYDLSLKLPAQMARLSDPRIKIYQTAVARNWCWKMELELDDATYHIFFEIRKSKPGDPEGSDLVLMVESAYAILKTATQPALVPNPLPFGMIVGKTYLDLPHYPPKFQK
jgi:hypothetical protein